VNYCSNLLISSGRLDAVNFVQVTLQAREIGQLVEHVHDVTLIYKSVVLLQVIEDGKQMRDPLDREVIAAQYKLHLVVGLSECVAGGMIGFPLEDESGCFAGR
jgi:hypothetical protein